MSYRKRKRRPPLFGIAVLCAVLLGFLYLSLRKAPAPEPPEPSAAPAETVPPVSSPALSPSPAAVPVTAPAAESARPAESEPPRPVLGYIPDYGAPQPLTREEAVARLSFYTEADWRIADILAHEADYPDGALIALANNFELIAFIRDCPASDGKTDGGFTAEELSAPHPLLLQWDSRWGYAEYGTGPLGLTGCGPTCLSMAALALTGSSSATPDAVAAYSLKHGYYTKGAGSKWTLISEGCGGFGLSARELPLWEDGIKKALDAGEMVICCVGAGDFTVAGHFIVLYGYTEEGFQVNDPNSTVRSGMLWPYSVLSGQISNLWALKAAK